MASRIIDVVQRAKDTENGQRESEREDRKTIATKFTEPQYQFSAQQTELYRNIYKKSSSLSLFLSRSPASTLLMAEKKI